MTPEERCRAAQAVGERIERLGKTVSQIADECNVDARTVRALVTGSRWPTVAVRNVIEDAIDWPRGEILRQARDGLKALAVFSDAELVAEVLQRIRRRERQDGRNDRTTP